MKSELEDGYIPLDEWLARPRTRLLRALRWFDWITAEELFIACDVGEHESEAFMKALSRAYRAGEVERRGAKNPYMYKLVIAVQMPTLVTTRAKRSYIAERRKKLADAGLCRNASLTGGGTVEHGPPVAGGRCDRCVQVQREAAKRRDVARGEERAA